MIFDITLTKMTIIIALQTIILILLLGLFNIYRKSYKNIKIGYTIGLLIFALMLIIKSIVEIAVSMSALFIGGSELSSTFPGHLLFETLIELIAIGVLYKITKDY